MRPTSAIVFDAYGTLFDTGDGSVRATREILLKLGSPLDPANVYEKWKAHMSQLTLDLADFIPEEEIFVAGLALTYKDFGISGRPKEDVQIMLATLGVRNLFPDALSCVERLKARFEVSIASNTDSTSFLKDLRRSGLPIDRWFTSESLRAYKPSAAFYHQMLSSLGKDPGEVVFVGDSLEADVLGPMTCGMRGIWLNRKGVTAAHSWPEMLEISGLEELDDVIITLS